MAPRWPKMAQDGTRMRQDSPRSPQDGCKMAPRWPQDGPKMAPGRPKMAQDGPKMAQDGTTHHIKHPKQHQYVYHWTAARPKIALRWSHDASRRPANGSTTLQNGRRGFKKPPSSPKMLPGRLQIAPRRPKMAQDGPKMAQDSPKMAPRLRKWV